MVSLSFTTLAQFASLAAAGVTVTRTHRAPTGYEATFTYSNATAINVTVAGGFHTFTDSSHTSPGASAAYDPRTSYEPGDFWAVNNEATTSPFLMTKDGNGTWSLTVPLPSGTYSYAFVTDCYDLSECTVDTGHWVVDPENPPFENVKGDADASSFQVPYDAQFQYTPEIDLNFDFQLPASMGHAGSSFYVNYTSPGSIHPATNVHYFGMHVPHGYLPKCGSSEHQKNGSGACSSKEYPVLYLSHGGSGDGSDWFNLAAVGNIMDNLIASGYIEPTILILPDFYNLNSEYTYTQGVAKSKVNPPTSFVRENFVQYLFPFVEENFPVSSSPAKRAFAGLSLGSKLTNEMYINNTAYFDYYGFFSGATTQNNVITAEGYINASILEQNPSLAQKGIFTSYGVFDIAIQDTRNLQTQLDALSINYTRHISPYHYWNTWADALWHYGQKSLWQPLPTTQNTARYAPLCGSTS